jgi:uncharacterized repeat protein (TIGR02543 family)
MVQKHLLNLYHARTVGMLSGARRTAMLFVTLLLTMTAQTAWAQTYTVSFNKCEGEGGNDRVTATLNEQMPDISVPTREGYTFGGYFTHERGEGTQYYDADGKSTHVWDKEEDATLYAMWTTDRININVLFTWENYGSYLDDAALVGYERDGLRVMVNDQSVSREFNYYPAISLEGQKNTISVTLPYWIYASSATYNYSDSGDNPVNDTPMTYEGGNYTWSFTIAENAISPQDRNVTIKINIGNASGRYTVFFDPNGGTGTMMYLIMEEGSRTLPNCTFTRNGYTFLGWATSADGPVAYLDGAEITAPQSQYATQTLYAKWFNNSAQMNTYTVTLNQQEGSGGTESVTATYGAAMPAITVPTKTGYDFDGYYTETNGGGTQYYNADGSSVCTWNITDNTTLYANWTAKQYTVTLDQQGGSGGTTSVNATYASAMPEIGLPTKTGYDFDGYYTETNGRGTQYYNANGTSARTCDLTAAVTLYAKWTANTYTVTLDHEGGENGSYEVTATYGADMPAITLPTKTGYDFDGYYTETNGRGTQYYNADGSSARSWGINANTTLHAHWKKCLSNTEITIEIPAQTYSGSQLTPVVTVKDNGSEVSDAHYTISLPEGRTNAGDYTINIEAKEGSTAYAGSKTATFTINQKDLTVTANDHTISYGDAPANDGVTYDGFVEGENQDTEGIFGTTTLTYAYKTANDITSEDYTTSSPAGTYYIIPSGLTATNYDITFVSGTLTVEPVPVKFSVVDIANGEELESATVQVLDGERNVVVEWVSATGPHEIDVLRTGEEYTVHETVAPEGYIISGDFTFTIGTGGSITSTGSTTTDEEDHIVLLVENSKTQVNICVVDIADGEELEGAIVQVIEKKDENEEEVVEEWTSTTEPHEIEGLKTGVEYTLRETVAPEGYTVATDITFTIDESGKVTTTGTITEDGVLLVENSKTQVKISVVDIADGAEIAGATVQVIDSEGNVVGEWTSTTEPHVIEGLATGEEYTVHETVAPSGYAIPTDFTFTIAEDGSITSSGSTTTDEEDHIVLLVENSKTQVNICVVDIANGEKLEGATVQVLDSEENVVEEWTSTTEIHEIRGLKTGEEYTVHETVAPNGYAIPTDFTFTIAEDGSITSSGNTTTDEEGLTVLLVENERTGDLQLSNTVYADNNEKEFTFTVTLDDETINGTYGDMTFTDGEATVTLKGGESATATGLPTGLNYTVTEEDAEGFDTSKTGDTGTISTTMSEVTFTYIQLVEVKVTKVWDDANDQDGYRPDDVTVNLAKNGEIIDTVILSEENSWTYTWTGLDKYNGEQAIDYTVTENAVAEYTTSITKADDGTFTYTVTNTYEPVTSGNCGPTDNEESVTWSYDASTKTLSISGTGYMMYYNSVQNPDESYSNGAPWKAFAEEIESVTIGNGITYVGSNTFAHCPSISSVTLPTSGIYQIGDGAFADCTSLESIDIPMSINNIGNQAFAGCSSLATVSIGYGDPGAFTLGSDVFPVTTTILVPESAYENYIKEKAINGNQEEINNPFYVYKNKIVPATRTFFANGTSTWMTWCDVNAWTLPEGCTAYTISSVSGTTVTLSEITATEANAPVIIPAYTPVLIQLGENATTPVTSAFSAVGTAPASGYDSTTGIASTTDTGWAFYGTTTDLATIPEANYSAGLTYVLYGDKFLKSDNNSGIAANRCWLKLEAGGGTSGARLLSIVIDDNPTAIDNVQWSMVNGQSDSWYTLDGRKLSGKPTKKGLYIYNGKKVAIK